jgi:EAL and modified HD-GYP domain-containing signal transduction protein
MTDYTAQSLPDSQGTSGLATELNKVYIGRQPVLDKHKRTFGYELLFRNGSVANANFIDNRQATASVMVNALNNIGITNLIGEKKGFINVDAGVLESGIIDLLPKNTTILELLETVEINDTLLDLCKKIGKAGYQFALDDFVYNESYVKIFDIVHYIKIDLLLNDKKTLPETVKILRQHNVKLLAEKVETREDFEYCLALGFDLFQGYFFAKPSVITGKSISPAQIVLLNLSKLLTKEEEFYIIEQLFRKNPELHIKLLQFMNSAAFYMPHKITSIQQSIALLGYRNLQKWVTLLLYAGENNDVKSIPIFERAAVRGRMMELLTQEITHDRTKADMAFIAGVLSLIGVLFQTSLESILKELNISQEINDALLNRDGPLGTFISIIEALEQERYDDIVSALKDFNIGIDKLFSIENNAIIEFERFNI